MTNLTLYKFITEKNIEYHWHDSEVVFFVPFYLLEKFAKLVGTALSDNEFTVVLKKDCIAVLGSDLLDGIDLKEVFCKQNWNE